MNMDDLQRAVYSKLNGDSGLSALVTGVYADLEQPDDAADAAGFPYITIGADSGVPWDTMTWLGADVTLQVDVWSRSNNFLEAKAVAKRVWELLHHQPLDIAGSSHVQTIQTIADFSRDPDGHTKRGMMQFRVRYETLQ